MENALKYSALFDLYGDLLTDKQRTYFTEYYFDDLSLSEIAENHDMSRNGVHKQIKDVLHKLDFYEEILHLSLKKEKICAIIEKIEDKKIKEELKEIL